MSDPEWLIQGLGGVGRLWPREQETLRLLAAGCSNTEIAAALVITPRSVEMSVKRVYRRLGLQGYPTVKRARAVLILQTAERYGYRVGRIPKTGGVNCLNG